MESKGSYFFQMWIGDDSILAQAKNEQVIDNKKRLEISA
jgi:hypothetical protein